MKLTKRLYVNMPNMYNNQPDEPETLNGLVYVNDNEDYQSEWLQENYHIEEANHADGKWYLILERSDYFSDDLELLESKLRDWLKGEGIELDYFGSELGELNEISN